MIGKKSTRPVVLTRLSWHMFVNAVFTAQQISHDWRVAIAYFFLNSQLRRQNALYRVIHDQKLHSIHTKQNYCKG
jgi:hypothetical protein